MSRQRRKRGLAPIKAKADIPPSQSAPQTVSFSFNNLSLHADNLNELQVVAMMPPSMQEQALELAKNEQRFRHEIVRQNLKNEHEAKMDAQEKDFQLHKTREKSLFWFGLSGQLFALFVVVTTLSALWFYLRTTSALPETMWRYVFWGVGIICAVILGRKFILPTK